MRTRGAALDSCRGKRRHGGAVSLPSAGLATSASLLRTDRGASTGLSVAEGRFLSRRQAFRRCAGLVRRLLRKDRSARGGRIRQRIARAVARVVSKPRVARPPASQDGACRFPSSRFTRSSSKPQPLASGRWTPPRDVPRLRASRQSCCGSRRRGSRVKSRKHILAPEGNSASPHPRPDSGAHHAHQDQHQGRRPRHDRRRRPLSTTNAGASARGAASHQLENPMRIKSSIKAGGVITGD